MDKILWEIKPASAVTVGDIIKTRNAKFKTYPVMDAVTAIKNNENIIYFQINDKLFIQSYPDTEVLVYHSTVKTEDTE